MREGSHMLGTGRPSGTLSDSHENREVLTSRCGHSRGEVILGEANLFRIRHALLITQKIPCGNDSEGELGREAEA